MRVHDALYGSGICEGKIPYRYMKQIMSTPHAQYESVTTWSQCNVQSFFPCWAWQPIFHNEAYYLAPSHNETDWWLVFHNEADSESTFRNVYFLSSKYANDLPPNVHYKHRYTSNALWIEQLYVWNPRKTSAFCDVFHWMISSIDRQTTWDRKSVV